jgi:LmbE family N-acetylglucosaminyl deacetylase
MTPVYVQVAGMQRGTMNMSLLRSADVAHVEEWLEHLCSAREDRMSSAAIVVAHPDDETLGAGSRLSRLRGATLVHVTDGSPRNLSDARAAGFDSREAYARARREELAAVMALTGIPPERAWGLGVVDQDAPMQMPAIARRLAEMFEEIRPEVVLTHPYEGGHPDHDATAFSVHAAVQLLRNDGAPTPGIIEMASYHARDDRMVVYEFLPAPDREARTVTLSATERAFKQRLIDCYRSQRTMLAQFPVRLERYRVAPHYDFERAPHPGKLCYELFPWGMTGERFRELVVAARAELGLEGAR